MSNEITQGSIISNIRSPKYPGIKCYGIIISARCDLAQGKIDCVHTITALTLSSWLQTAVFQKALSIEIKSQLKIIQKWAQIEGEDLESLVELGPDKAILNVEANPQSIEYAKALSACKLWKQYMKYRSGDVSANEIATFLNGAGKSTRISTLNELFSGSLTNYCFIPESVYLGNGNKCDGLVADFKDIIPFTLEQITAMQRGEYDYLRILSGDEEEQLNQQFYLETTDDAVEIKYEIKPPWIERLMQNFSYSFIRIGVDTITKSEGNKLSKQTIYANELGIIWNMEGTYGVS